MKTQKGFTIIELIVVIAIIAVLAAIVLVNVTQYIAKSRNSAIKGNMASLMTNGAAYFDQNVTALGNAFEIDTVSGCAGPIANAISDAGAVDFTCEGSSTTQAWCARVTTLAAGADAAGTWCVDSTGYKGETATNCIPATTTFTCQ